MASTIWSEKGIRMEALDKSAPDGLAARAAAVAGLADEIWHEHYTPIIGAAQVDYMVPLFQSAERIYADIMEAGFVYLTATEVATGRLFGYCGVVPMQAEGYLLLSKLYIHKGFRGKGVARCFLDEVCGMCRAVYGMERIRLTVNKYNADAIAVYKKMGFATIDEVKADIGGGFYMDDYIMELSL